MEKYVYEIRESWSTEYDGNSYHVKDIIVNNEEQVMEYLKDNYNIDDMNDISDGISLIFEKTAKYWCSDHGNLHEVTDECEHCDKSEDNTCDEHFWQTDTIEAVPYYEHDFKGKPATKAQLEYLKSGKHFCNVVDLTE